MTSHELENTRALVEMTGMDFTVLAEDDDSPMSVLTIKQRLWVVAYCALAGVHGAMTRAAEYAGYAPNTWAVRGSQNYQRKDIQAAIKYLAETKAHVSAFAAMATIEQLNRTGTDPIRLKAAGMLLAHAGIIIKTIHHHEITLDDNRDEDQIMQAVLDQMKELGLDATEVIEATLADDDRSHESGNRPEGMNQGRTPKQTLIPGKDRPGYKPGKGRGHRKYPDPKPMDAEFIEGFELVDFDVDFDDVTTEEYDFDDC